MSSPASISETFRRTASSFFAGARREWIDLLPQASDMAVLELGCGSGSTGALALREHRCATWVGIEANPAHAAEALYALTDVHVGDPLSVELPYKAGTFDILFCGEALRENPAAILGRLAPLVRRGGEVFIVLDGSGDASAKGFEPAAMRKLLKRAGVTPERVQGLHPLPARGWFAPRRFARIEARGRIR